ncbi:MAG: hypothetical protein HYS65_14485 [Betaproteobacteria bacterium]|nr:hypothetical protein [Betaproteobacteria bacterium]MBI2225771.1 hypothetical protein [Betaproteobacteria bacterium]MBI3056333.1 hypothetical protein [Betaproteobacteria bacterium]
MKKWPFMGWLAGIGLLSFASSAADGQAFPSKPIRIVVPFTAGGAADILARIVGDKFAEMWNRPIVIDNRAGAAGNIAAEIVAKSPPDGYTLLMGSMGTQAMNVSLYRKLPFEAMIREDTAKWAKVAKAAGATAE